ncbi:hypothetical protein GCG54_00008531 [Colletotrichum gloeosporioides]|uniref:Aminotransferase class I/classII large domain-containing protein n=1 Tax=Colletotrichum gloeosporioides TaxID=474922 RepID=A0A8H4CI16_COLGL|nr:uncharacterized protein GCG54_00008531 [Colletotrichum gloeosporioides]KAF3804027.1 hypothetical protein GCG54_00008531 [Colletotrichum gloeosporioides]
MAQRLLRPIRWSIPSERIVITNGASNGLATILQKFTDPSTRAVWMADPTYFLACPIFRDAGLMARIRGAPEGEDGVDLDFLAKALQEVDDGWPADASLPPRKLAKTGYPKIYKHVIYLIPTFSNPRGKTMGIENRRKLVQLARKHDALIITDDVYDMLRWLVADNGDSNVAGGFFLYVSFGKLTGAEIAQVALQDFNLKIAPGSIFAVPDDPLSTSRGETSCFNGARLCWAWHEKEELVEGIERLAAAIGSISETRE